VIPVSRDGVEDVAAHTRYSTGIRSRDLIPLLPGYHIHELLNLNR